MKNPWDQRLGFWHIAEEFPSELAVVASPEGEFTFGELAGKAHQLVHGLRDAGLKEGDVVAFMLPNGVDIVAWQLAALEAGWHYIALNPYLSQREIEGILEDAGAAAVAVHSDCIEEREVEELRRGRGDGVWVSVGDAMSGCTRDVDISAGQPKSMPERRHAGRAFTYTSGTTGRPKGIWRDLPEGDPSDVADEGKVFGRAFQFRPFEGPHLVSAGMYHAGCASFYLGALNVGQGLVIMPKFDAEEALQCIEGYGVRTAYMVPTQFVRLLRLDDRAREKYECSSLESVVHSAAPCPLEVKKEMFEWWGPVIYETYGGTEGAATIAKPHRWLEKPGTVGRPIRGMRVKIVDENGRELPDGEIGQVYMEPERGRSFEYYGDREGTEEAYRGRAFTIGDIGYLDEDGYLFICDRKKDMIITGGVNVYPAEVEGVLKGHPSVMDAGVVGVPDEEWGESVKAVVEVVDGKLGSEELEQELIGFCRKRLAKYKCPRSVDFWGSLPRTEAGKLYKRRIRETFWSESGRQV